jgi:protease I
MDFHRGSIAHGRFAASSSMRFRKDAAANLVASWLAQRWRAETTNIPRLALTHCGSSHFAEARVNMSRVAFLVDEMFEDSEFRVPYERIRNAGHEAVIVGLAAGKRLTGKSGKEKITTERAADDVSADDFDAVVIPGGYSPDHLRMSSGAVRLVQQAFIQGKPVAAVCHAGWMLVEADIADDRTLTSWPSIKTDMLNAGAHWVDREVVEDDNLITSRRPSDLPAFSDAILRQLERGVAPRAETTESPQPTGQERPQLHRVS